MDNLNWSIIGLVISGVGAIASAIFSFWDKPEHKKYSIIITTTITIVGLIISGVDSHIKSDKELVEKNKELSTLNDTHDKVNSLRDKLESAYLTIEKLKDGNSGIKQTVDSSKIAVLQSILAQAKLKLAFDSLARKKNYDRPVIDDFTPGQENPILRSLEDKFDLVLYLKNQTQYSAENIEIVAIPIVIRNHEVLPIAVIQHVRYTPFVKSDNDDRLMIVHGSIMKNEIVYSQDKKDDFYLYYEVKYTNSSNEVMKPFQAVYEVDLNKINSVMPKANLKVHMEVIDYMADLK